MGINVRIKVYLMFSLSDLANTILTLILDFISKLIMQFINKLKLRTTLLLNNGIRGSKFNISKLNLENIFNCLGSISESNM